MLFSNPFFNRWDMNNGIRCRLQT